MLGHKVRLGKCKKIEITSNTFSDHNAMRLHINYKKKKFKKCRHMKTKQYVTKQWMDYWRNQRENQKLPRNKWEWKQN